MADLTLDQLLKISFLPDDVKKEATQKLSEMTDDQKFRLEQICWENLRDWYLLRVEAEKEKMITEMAQETTTYEPGDFEQTKDRILTELLSKVEEVKTDQQLKEMKKELKSKIHAKFSKVVSSTPSSSVPKADS